ncbi:hypothetical protein AX25_11355 [Listeria ivanovii WSLC3009]|nr:hypothetical protein AX25_11355 [Listeria ivanovii WSLC3009]
MKINVTKKSKIYLESRKFVFITGFLLKVFGSIITCKN